MRAAPRWIASSPDAQTLLIVVAEAADRNAGLQRGLASRSLAGTGLKHLAHQDVLDQLRLGAGACQRGSDRHGAQVGHRQTGQGAEELTDRCPRGANQAGLSYLAAHRCSPRWRAMTIFITSEVPSPSVRILASR